MKRCAENIDLSMRPVGAEDATHFYWREREIGGPEYSANSHWMKKEGDNYYQWSSEGWVLDTSYDSSYQYNEHVIELPKQKPSKIVYIMGPMTGHVDFNRFAFNHSAFKLKQQGFTVLNPATLPDGLTELQYMDICLAMLRSANAVYALKGWQDSAGANVEMALAKKLKLEIMEQ